MLGNAKIGSHRKDEESDLAIESMVYIRAAYSPGMIVQLNEGGHSSMKIARVDRDLLQGSSTAFCACQQGRSPATLRLVVC